MQILRYVFYVSCVSALILIVENMAYNNGYGMLYIHKNASVVSIILFSLLSGIGIGAGAFSLLKKEEDDY